MCHAVVSQELKTLAYRACYNVDEPLSSATSYNLLSSFTFTSPSIFATVNVFLHPFLFCSRLCLADILAFSRTRPTIRSDLFILQGLERKSYPAIMYHTSHKNCMACVTPLHPCPPVPRMSQPRQVDLPHEGKTSAFYCPRKILV